MPSGLVDPSASYSPLTGLVYVFNLIVGTGALTLPAAFKHAGWGLGLGAMLLLAFMSFVTASFMVEAMAAANAIKHWKRVQRMKRPSGSGTVSDDFIERLHIVGDDDASPGLNRAQSNSSLSSLVHGNPENASEATTSTEAIASDGEVAVDEHEPLIDQGNFDEEESEHDLLDDNVDRLSRNVTSYYNITEVVEMGQMASMFFNKTGRTLFFLCITLYLYGDLAIYGAAVAKSLRDVACTYNPYNASLVPHNVSEDEDCWKDGDMTRGEAYRIALAIFVGLVGPFTFFNVQKTKYLQVLTSVMRWLAFLSMVGLACERLASGNGAEKPPAPANFAGVPSLFGVCVYSFMCHHSLPSLVTPISRKRHLFGLLLVDYSLILCFYLLLALTGVFAFTDIEDLYTLNFQPQAGEPLPLAIVHYFLSLFPVFTLATNFPIIAITLRNNLKSLFLTEGRIHSFFTRRIVFPLLALGPPLAVAFATNSLELLVGVTGSYAGAGVQYVFPALLVYFGRRASTATLGVGVRNVHASVFAGDCWVVFVNVWAVACVALVTYNHVAALVK